MPDPPSCQQSRPKARPQNFVLASASAFLVLAGVFLLLCAWTGTALVAGHGGPRRAGARWSLPGIASLVGPQSGVRLTRAWAVAWDDAALRMPHPFSLGSRPVIRWVKGSGNDDNVTRAAIGQVTRLFGARADYALLTPPGYSAARAREVLAWAVQPVEWRRLEPSDNAALARWLWAANCSTENFGYWWKWFPERLRPDAPELILDGDMVLTAKPEWADEWLAGSGPPRVSQDDRHAAIQMHAMGQYGNISDPFGLMLYSGAVFLPPKLRYMELFERVLRERPLANPHDGTRDADEQGVFAAAFSRLVPRPVPIPLYEFPFCRAFENFTDFGVQGDQGKAWGYHFGRSFAVHNPHFDRLSLAGTVLNATVAAAAAGQGLAEAAAAATRWLSSVGQWGIPGWGLSDGAVANIVKEVLAHANCNAMSILDSATSRGRIAAALAVAGCHHVTTLDLVDRGAAANLAGLEARVLLGDVDDFLATSAASHAFNLLIIDIHGNDPVHWAKRGPLVAAALPPGGLALVSNARLHRVDGWEEESGVPEWLERLPAGWVLRVIKEPPGLAVIRKPL